MDAPWRQMITTNCSSYVCAAEAAALENPARIIPIAAQPSVLPVMLTIKPFAPGCALKTAPFALLAMRAKRLARDLWPANRNKKTR